MGNCCARDDGAARKRLVISPPTKTSTEEKTKPTGSRTTSTDLELQVTRVLQSVENGANNIQKHITGYVQKFAFPEKKEEKPTPIPPVTPAKPIYPVTPAKPIYPVTPIQPTTSDTTVKLTPLPQILLSLKKVEVLFKKLTTKPDEKSATEVKAEAKPSPQITKAKIELPVKVEKRTAPCSTIEAPVISDSTVKALKSIMSEICSVKKVETSATKQEMPKSEPLFKRSPIKSLSAKMPKSEPMFKRSPFESPSAEITSLLFMAKKAINVLSKAKSEVEYPEKTQTKQPFKKGDLKAEEKVEALKSKSHEASTSEKVKYKLSRKTEAKVQVTEIKPGIIEIKPGLIEIKPANKIIKSPSKTKAKPKTKSPEAMKEKSKAPPEKAEPKLTSALQPEIIEIKPPMKVKKSPSASKIESAGKMTPKSKAESSLRSTIPEITSTKMKGTIIKSVSKVRSKSAPARILVSKAKGAKMHSTVVQIPSSATKVTPKFQSREEKSEKPTKEGEVKPLEFLGKLQAAGEALVQKVLIGAPSQAKDTAAKKESPGKDVKKESSASKSAKGPESKHTIMKKRRVQSLVTPAARKDSKAKKSKTIASEKPNAETKSKQQPSSKGDELASKATIESKFPTKIKVKRKITPRTSSTIPKTKPKAGPSPSTPKRKIKKGKPSKSEAKTPGKSSPLKKTLSEPEKAELTKKDVAISKEPEAKKEPAREDEAKPKETKKESEKGDELLKPLDMIAAVGETILKKVEKTIDGKELAKKGDEGPKEIKKEEPAIKTEAKPEGAEPKKEPGKGGELLKPLDMVNAVEAILQKVAKVVDTMLTKEEKLAKMFKERLEAKKEPEMAKPDTESTMKGKRKVPIKVSSKIEKKTKEVPKTKAMSDARKPPSSVESQASLKDKKKAPKASPKIQPKGKKTVSKATVETKATSSEKSAIVESPKSTTSSAKSVPGKKDKPSTEAKKKVKVKVSKSVWSAKAIPESKETKPPKDEKKSLVKKEEEKVAEKDKSKEPMKAADLLKPFNMMANIGEVILKKVEKMIDEKKETKPKEELEKLAKLSALGEALVQKVKVTLPNEKLDEKIKKDEPKPKEPEVKKEEPAKKGDQKPKDSEVKKEEPAKKGDHKPKESEVKKEEPAKKGDQKPKESEVKKEEPGKGGEPLKPLDMGAIEAILHKVAKVLETLPNREKEPAKKELKESPTKKEPPKTKATKKVSKASVKSSLSVAERKIFSSASSKTRDLSKMLPKNKPKGEKKRFKVKVSKTKASNLSPMSKSSPISVDSGPSSAKSKSQSTKSQVSKFTAPGKKGKVLKKISSKKVELEKAEPKKKEPTKEEAKKDEPKEKKAKKYEHEVRKTKSLPTSTEIEKYQFKKTFQFTANQSGKKFIDLKKVPDDRKSESQSKSATASIVSNVSSAIRSKIPTKIQSTIKASPSSSSGSKTETTDKSKLPWKVTSKIQATTTKVDYSITTQKGKDTLSDISISVTSLKIRKKSRKTAKKDKKK